MTFGELINQESPILMLFSSDWHPEHQESKFEISEISRDTEVRTILIDAGKNQDLCDGLGIKTLPTVMIYKKEQMLYRHSGKIESDKIIEFLQ